MRLSTEEKIDLILEKVTRLESKNKNPLTDGRDEQLLLYVLPLTYDSAMNFVPNDLIFQKLKDKLNVSNSSHLSRILVKNGFHKSVRTVDGKQKRGFLLKFM